MPLPGREPQVGGRVGEGDEAQLVDDQQVLAGQQLLQALQAAFVGGLDQLMHQGGGGREADLQALLTGCQSQAEGDMGLAGSARPERDDVLASVDELAAGEFRAMPENG